MVWVLVGLQKQREDVGQVGTTRLLVDGTLIQVGGLAGLVHVGGKNVGDWEGSVQDLGGGLYQATVPAVPAGPIQEQAVDVHTFVGRGVDVLLHHPGDLVVQYHGVQSPALVGAGNLLSHGSQETLRVEESGHPERSGSSLKQPGGELLVSVQEVGEPEPEGG